MSKFDSGFICGCIYMALGFFIYIVFTIRTAKRQDVILEYVPSKDDWLLK